MYEARTLNQLQSIDLEIDGLNDELEGIEAGIGETEELIEARQALDDARKQLHERQSTQRELEWEAEELTAKIKDEEERMYGGRVRNPKELESIRRDAELVRSKRSAVEDRVLELMGEVEGAQAGLTAARADWDRVSAEWEAQQRALAERQAQIAASLAELDRSRRAAAAGIAPALLATYEDLRRSKHGRAVARVERNTCQGCRISLPMSVVQHARLGRDLVHCPSCLRILFAER